MCCTDALWSPAALTEMLPISSSGQVFSLHRHADQPGPGSRWWQPPANPAEDHLYWCMHQATGVSERPFFFSVLLWLVWILGTVNNLLPLTGAVYKGGRNSRHRWLIAVSFWLCGHLGHSGRERLRREQHSKSWRNCQWFSRHPPLSLDINISKHLH